MPEILETPLRGKIKTHGKFLPIYGVVELDEPRDNLKYAIINDETNGRVALLNLSPDGRLPVGQKVLINKAKIGGGAFVALDVLAVAMSPFEHFSEEISKVAELHQKSGLARLAYRTEYLWRRYWANRPFPFAYVDSKEGEPAGEPIDIHHLRLHDMMEHEARGQLTARVLLKGLRANAFFVVRSEGFDLQGKTTIQPCWV